MKLSHLLGVPLALTVGCAFAEDNNAVDSQNSVLYLAAGLSVDEKGDIQGWYDANKTEKEDEDDEMCYAASASNLIAWWENGENAVAGSTPHKLEDIWKTFVDNNQDSTDGGYPLPAINWWLSGVYMPVNGEDGELLPVDDPTWQRFYTSSDELYDETDSDSEGLTLTLPNYEKNGTYFGGYYYDQYGLTQNNLNNFLVEIWSCDSAEEPDTEEGASVQGSYTLGTAEVPGDDGPESIFDIDFEEIFENSAISLGIISEDENIAHAITLWGVEYDENGNLTTMWLTDSDDFITQIFSVDVTMNDKENKIYLGKLAQITQEVEGVEETYLAYYDEIYGENVYIANIFAIDTSESAKWQLVPEPTTATLSLFALAALAARRRRK